MAKPQPSYRTILHFAVVVILAKLLTVTLPCLAVGCRVGCCFPIVSAADSALRLRPRASPHQVPHTCTILTTATSQHPTNPTQPTSIPRSPLAAQQNEESFPGEPPQQHLPPADSTPAKHRRIPTGLQSAAKLRKSRHVPDSPGIIPAPRPLFLLL